MFILVWQSPWQIRREYFSNETASKFTNEQKQASRFETRAQAYQAAEPTIYFGAAGKDDRIGWKVVRLVKKKAG